MTDFPTNMTTSPATPRPIRAPLGESPYYVHVAPQTVDGVDVAALVAGSAGNLPTPIPAGDMLDCLTLGRANSEIPQ